MTIRNHYYKYHPQMALYDTLGSKTIFSPYLMFRSPKNFKSDVVNTDLNSFRLSGSDGKLRLDSLDSSNIVNVLTGASTAFGVGATSDKSTISAYLSNLTRDDWVNFAGRAYSSSQEFISFAYHRDFVKSIDNIVIFSGINDLYLYFATKYFNQQFGSLFMASNFMNNMNRDLRPRTLVTRPIINKLLKLMYGENDFNLVSNKDAINLLFRRTPINKVLQHLSQYDTINTHNQNPSEIIDVFKRNISNWKIMADYYNAKITFILQPFANWLDDQTLTSNEKEVFELLDRLGGENGKIIFDKMNGLHNWYSKELNKACNEKKINYFDSNLIFNGNHGKDIFVDRVHLTDYGNKILSNFILEKI